MSARTTMQWVLLATVAAAIVAGLVSPIAALLLGAAVASVVGAPKNADLAARHVLAGSIVALGCGVDLVAVLAAGRDGLLPTLCMLALTFGCGWLLARRFGIRRDVALLVTAGTAICGGSAIATVAPLLRARAADVAAALAVVYLLNGLALLLFPAIGTGCALDADSFGTWCALAIHDTSSVVGAAASRDQHALEVATVTKLTRMLWIVPVGLAIVWSRRDAVAARARSCPALPWSLIGFVLAASLVSIGPGVAEVGAQIARWAPTGMTLALFGMGLGMTGSSLRGVVGRALAFGFVLWALLATASLVYVVSLPQ